MPLKLGLLGMWHVHTSNLVRQIALHGDEFTLVAAFDPDPRVRARRAGEWANLLPSLPLLDDPHAVLAREIDAVVIEGQVWQNLQWAKSALDAGLPVLLEKPAGDDLDDYRSVQDLARRKGLHLQMLYLFRYMTAVQDVFARVARGELGTLHQFRARMPKDPSIYETYVDELGRYKGGMFFEMAGHMVDMMITLLGEPKAIHPFLSHHHPTPGSFIDNSVVVFEFDRAIATLEVNALEPSPFTRRYEIYGSEGAIAIPHLGSGHLRNRDVQPLEFHRKGADDWQRIDHPANPLQIGDLREFAAVLAGRKAPDRSPEHDLLVQRTLLRASGMA